MGIQLALKVKIDQNHEQIRGRKVALLYCEIGDVTVAALNHYKGTPHLMGSTNASCSFIFIW